MNKRTRLGIAGVPVDADAVHALSRARGVEPVFLLDPASSTGGANLSGTVVSLPETSDEDLVRLLAPLGLAGVWVAEGRYHRRIGPVANRLGWPRIPCPFEYPDCQVAIPGALNLSLDAFASLVKQGGHDVDVPAWVRSSCGDADASCMRVEHPSDLSLALQKLRNRNPTGLLRIQPTVEGTIYRLMAFKTGRDLTPFDVVEEFVTPSVYRVSLGMSMPVPRRGTHQAEILRQARAVNEALPHGWGYVEMEFVATPSGVVLTDVQAPARLGEDLRAVVRLSQGVDLLRASMECALGERPTLTPTMETGIAFTWLLTRSGVVTGFDGVEEARAMPGIVEVVIHARTGDILSHVVDLPSRERGGYIIARGATGEMARERLEATRERVWINTSPALS